MTAEAISQPVQALGLAKAAKCWRNGARDTVAALPQREGRLAVAGLLTRRMRRDYPNHLAGLPVDRVLGWIFKWKPSQTRKVLDAAGIASENRLVGELTDRQRCALAEALTNVERSA